MKNLFLRSAFIVYLGLTVNSAQACLLPALYRTAQGVRFSIQELLGAGTYAGMLIKDIATENGTFVTFTLRNPSGSECVTVKYENQWSGDCKQHRTLLRDVTECAP